MNFSAIDYSVLYGYLLTIIGVGCWAGWRVQKNRTHRDKGYFLAGGSLHWPVIGLALFSTNISTIHLVSLAQEGYVNGLAYGNFEWMATFTLIVLAIFFVPFYIRTRVATLPDFIERRYSRASRDWLAGLSIISAIFIHCGFTLYAGALVLQALFGVDAITSVTFIAVVTGLYTVVGGLLAVVMTESIQTVVMVSSALALTYLGLEKAGGWQGVVHSVDPHLLTILRPAGDPSGLPWYAVMLGYPVIGIWYWCTDQTIVQRVLGAKNIHQARTGVLFTGFLKILPVFIFLFPGLILLALVNQGVLAAPAHSNQAYTYLISQILPTGLKGLLAAALLAASMGTVAGALNSAATLFSYDLWRKWKPHSTDQDLVRVGRIVTVFALLAAIVWSPLLGRYPTVFQGINAAISYIAPPVTVIFLFGIFWRRASSAASITTLVSGSTLGLGVFLLDWFKVSTGWSVPFMMAGFYLACICAAIMIIVSWLKPDPWVQERQALVWKHPFEALREPSTPGIGSYKVLSVLLLVTMIYLYWRFR